MERRECPRIDLTLPVDAHVREEGALACRTADLSETGVALVARAPVEPGAPVRLHWAFDPDHQADVDAVVVRCDPAPTGFVLGARFVESADPGGDRWRRFLAAKRAGAGSLQQLDALTLSTESELGLEELYRDAVEYIENRSAPASRSRR